MAPIPSESSGVRVLPPAFNAVGLYAAENNPIENPDYLSSDYFHALIAAATKPAIHEIMRVHGLANEDELRRRYEVHIFYQNGINTSDGFVFYWPRARMKPVSA